MPVDPLEWQLSQDTANKIFATLANTVGAAESVLRVAATGHDKRLFCRVRPFSNKKIGINAPSSLLLYGCVMCVSLFFLSSSSNLHFTAWLSWYHVLCLWIYCYGRLAAGKIMPFMLSFHP